jgi:hypothetical protein
MIRTHTFSALALFALLPAAASSQMSPDLSAVDREIRAEVLTEQAYLVAGQRADFVTAASWLRDAAELTGRSAESVRSLMNAGHFHFYSHRSLEAASAFNSAGELALELGDQETAIRAFRNGAFAADRVGDTMTAQQLMARSQSIEADMAITTVTVQD